MTTQDHSGTHATLADSGDTLNSQELPRGSNLGRYVIIEPIGSGGMGTVYRAYDPQLNRGVALKILSVKQADLQAAERAKARLIREAQALAQLSHPNVVAVHDAGTFEDDVFIAMELVEGKTLDEWLKEEKITVKEILGVMIAAGRGLSAAHKAGLVHRDFKPGNVVVGDDGRVRVLDFGLARAVDQAEEIEENPTVEPAPETADEQSHAFQEPFDWKEVTSDSSPNLLQSPLTHAGGILGTPLYMAPEQHLGLKADERTDQFGFCVVLYEVLYGKRPFMASTRERLKSEVIRQQVLVPRADSNVPAWLWKIIYKGLSVEPEDRYATIDSLLEELEKDPEEVRRQKHLSRRRKLFVISLILLTITLPIGIWHGVRYRTFQLCKDAEGEFEDVWDDTTKASVQKAFLGTKIPYALGTLERVERIFGNYLNDWMRMRSDVCEARIIRGTQSEELFDLRMSCLNGRKQELQALTKSFTEADADVVQKSVQASSSLSSVAICADEKALRAPYPPPKNPEDKTKVAAIRAKLAQVEALSKTGKYKKGLDLAKELNEKAKTVAYQPVQAEVLFQLGVLFYKIGDFKTAETTLYDAACAAGESRDSRLAAWASTFLVSVVGYAQGRPDAGLLIGRFADFIIELGGGDDALRSRFLNNLGGVWWNEGNYDNALNHFCNALEIQKKVFGPKHPEVASTLNNIGAIYYIIGDFDKALEYYSRSLTIREKVLGMEHPDVALSLNNIGLTFAKLGEYDEALLNHKRALGIREKSLGPEHPDVAHSLSNQGLVLAELGDYDMALQQILKSLAIRKKVLGNQHPEVAQVNNDLGIVLVKHGEYEKALFHFRKALTIWEAALGPRHPDVTWPLSGIGSILVDQGNSMQALKPLERVVSLCETKTCDLEPHGHGLFAFARALLTTGGEKERALKLAKQAREIMRKTPKAFKKELEEVNAWLKNHGVKPSAKKAQQ